MGYNYTPIRMAKLKQFTNNSNCWQGGGETGSLVPC